LIRVIHTLHEYAEFAVVVQRHKKGRIYPSPALLNVSSLGYAGPRRRAAEERIAALLIRGAAKYAEAALITRLAGPGAAAGDPSPYFGSRNTNNIRAAHTSRFAPKGPAAGEPFRYFGSAKTNSTAAPTSRFALEGPAWNRGWRRCSSTRRSSTRSSRCFGRSSTRSSRCFGRRRSSRGR